MNAGSTWLVCKTVPRWQAVVSLLFAGTMAAVAVAEGSAYGALVLQSPVQAVATINGEGAFLLIPGQDLRWSRIPPGHYRIAVRSGGQQWQREVQVQSGRTETLVATLSAAGSRLATGAPPPSPVNSAVPAYIPPPPSSPDAIPSPPPVTATQQRKEEREEQAAQRRLEQERRRQQREDRAAQQRRREDDARALREAWRREREQQEEEEKSQRRRRPKVH